MDINAADIAALEKILHWAEDIALQDPQKQGEESPAHEHDEPPPEEAREDAEMAEPALAIEVDAEPKPSTLKSYSFGGARPRPPEPEQKPVKSGGRRGRY